MDSIIINNNPDSFSVYSGFVDKFIKDANASFIKVYIYIVRHSNDKDGMTYEKIAKDTGLLKSDVVASLKFWQENDAITLDNNSITINKIAEPQQSLIAETHSENKMTEERVLQPNTSVASSYKGAEVVKTVNSDRELASLFMLVSQILNKNLSTNDYKIIYSFIDYLKLPEQVIIILFEYCASNGKTNMRYIEKIAYSWADNGITTPDLANKFVKNSNKEQSILSTYKKNFRISGREFTQTEEKMLLSWINDYKADEELIMRAYDCAVMNTGKVSFRYMDSIIKNEIESKNVKNGQKLSSNIEKSKFRNYPSDKKISEAERQAIARMMMDFGGEDDAVNE
ncbi:MAG: DnaD domain protein [Clostridia bacterium]|nr:DnaD domain protein [Clostridia bacterium]